MKAEGVGVVPCANNVTLMSTGGKHASSSRCEIAKVDGDRDMRVDVHGVRSVE